MNDTHQELRDLITAVVTGEGAQLENPGFTDNYYRKMAKEQSGGTDIIISMDVELWIRLLDVARNNLDIQPEEDE